MISSDVIIRPWLDFNVDLAKLPPRIGMDE